MLIKMLNDLLDSVTALFRPKPQVVPVRVLSERERLEAAQNHDLKMR